MSIIKWCLIPILIIPVVTFNIYAGTLEEIYKKLDAKPKPIPSKIETITPQIGYIEGTFRGKKYALYVPEDYTSEKKWPIILGFHYSTGSGADYIIHWQSTAQKYGYILLCPDSSNNEYWGSTDEQRVMALLKKTMKRYNIDKTKVYVTGFSAGAHFSYCMGLKYTKLFKAIVSIGGSLFKFYDRGDIRLSKSDKKHIPIYIIHGTADETVPISAARRSRDLLEKYGYQVKYEEIHGHGHTHPHQVNERVIDWLEKLQ